MTKKQRLSRREFVKSTGAAALGGAVLSSPMHLLFQSLLDGIVNKAYADVNGTGPRAYFYLTLPGAPPAWVWSQFLTPYGSAGFRSSPGFGTRYSAENGRYTDIAYSTTLINGVNAPHMWQFPVAAAGGGMRPMSDLLNHLLSVQGISTGNAGHPGSRALQMLPLGARQSVMAMAGDTSSAPIAGIGVATQNYVYRSRTGRSPVIAPLLNDALNTILDAFKRNAPASFVADRTAIEAAIEQAVNTLNTAAEGSHAAARAIAESRGSARAVVASGLANYETSSAALVAKYNDLIRRTVDPTIVMPGINDLPIGTTGTRDQRYRYGDTRIISNADMRTMISTNTGSMPMARAFAIAEYVLVNRLSNSLAMALPGLSGLMHENTAILQFYDEHGGGKMPSLLVNTYFYRAVSACLIELIDRLKAANLFNDTVINVAGEFTRSPREDGIGTDHGWRGAHITAFTGMLSQPLILGNIKNTTDRGYPGTWGEGGPIEALAGATLDLGHSTSTLAALLGVPSPITAKPSLVIVRNGTIVPTIETTRITG